ncbi:hypothetical protein [Streptomyces spiramenti]|uniref:Integral membrane protein n=1 Tax=Streptomyces spiramenti TaxID=2720606 RepID=A0ABX1AKN7_9ACTN|nr:hypothetical protein [Streptomyces spiramenti]NJP67673.1 hypothetical protein [Streptomyces spiramenti]
MGQRAEGSARDHALAVLRVRNWFLAVAMLPAAGAALAVAAVANGHLAAGWTPLRWAAVAAVGLLSVAALLVAATIARSRPPVTPTLPVPERSAPALYALIADLADRLDVPAPSGIALTPDCDSWLEEPPRRGGAAREGAPAPFAADPAGSGRPAPVLVIGSPFLWWLRTPELRALLAPVVAGTGPSRHPDIAAARRCIRGLDAAAGAAPGTNRLRRPLTACAAAVARAVLRRVGSHATEMERGVAAAASARARHVDPALRQAAQEQVGLAFAGWDRLLTRVALPAWRLGRWPGRLNAGVVSSLTELSRRDRLADGFTERLGERPACDLLEDPGGVDREVSLLAARLFHGPPPAGPGASAPSWEAVDWAAYPAQIVDRLWRERAGRLAVALGAVETRTHGTDRAPALGAVLLRLASDDGDFTDALAARLAAATARAEHEAEPVTPASSIAAAPLAFPAPPPPSGRELLAQHVAAAVCRTVVDTAGGAPALDWLDGPVLTVDGERAPDLSDPVLALVDEGDPEPLRGWLAEVGVHSEKLVRRV